MVTSGPGGFDDPFPWGVLSRTTLIIVPSTFENGDAQLQAIQFLRHAPNGSFEPTLFESSPILSRNCREHRTGEGRWLNGSPLILAALIPVLLTVLLVLRAEPVLGFLTKE